MSSGPVDPPGAPPTGAPPPWATAAPPTGAPPPWAMAAPGFEPGRGARHTGRRGWWRPWTPLALGLVLAFALGILASVVSLPYAIMSPGPATNVLGQHTKADGSSAPRIVIEAATTYPTTGALDFTTVSVRGGPGYPVNAVDVVAAWLDPDSDVLPVEELFPPEATKEQVAEENKAEMVGSQQEAAAVALRALGRQVPLVVTISKLSAGSPSEGQLQAGDVLVTVGGVPASDPAAIRAAVQQATPGEQLEVVVTRAGARVTAHPRTARADDGRIVLGILLRTDYDLPFPVRIDAGNVGGPSAGLMFALGIYDKLTDGALTGGYQIAGTGTIDDRGAVGPIGGIRQKIAGARDAGARFFLAPAGNCRDLAAGAPEGIQVVSVDTFEHARAAVEAIARGETAALPHC